MYTRDEVYRLFPMRNTIPVAFELIEADDSFTMKLLVQSFHSGAQTTVQLDIPKLDSNGTFDCNGITRQICSVMRGNPMFNKRAMDVNFCYIIDPRKVVLEWIGRAINLHLRQFYMTNRILEPNLAQMYLDKLLKTSPLSHAVKGLASSYPSKVFLDFHQTRPDERMPFNTRGILDWTSISQSSSKCGANMYLCSGMVHNGQTGAIVKRGRPYCTILDEFLVLPQHSRRRTSAANFKASTPLVRPDKPLVYGENYSKDKGGLSGKHLFTVHGIIPGVYKEQIVVSESAARKMASIIPEQQAVVVPGWCKNTLTILVRVNDQIEPNQPVLEYMDNDNKVVVTAHVRRPSTVRSIKVVRTRVYQRECAKILVKYERVHLLKSGDKVINRHGNKGIVRIVPDKEMPVVSGRPAEVVTNALATLKRRNPGQIIEAMVNHINADPQNGPCCVEHFTDQGTGLLEFCKKQKHTYNGQTQYAWSGKVYWMVLDKYSHMVRSHVTERKTDLDGIYANSGRRSGSRIYLTVMQLMLAKNMKPLLDRLIQDNMTGIERIQKYLYCLVNG